MMIRVYRFEDAPVELQALSNHGGDEDWLAVVPYKMTHLTIPWLEKIGVYRVSEYGLDNGDLVYIGAHA